MRRVELVIAYNATKEAAERNGGLVADKEVHDLESDRPYFGSMATKIAFDICLICGNKSPKRSDYCTEDTCPGGGMKKHAGRVLSDGRVVIVSNHGNRFFDYSRVHRHADRTAAVLGKVASAQQKTGAELAEDLGLSVPAWLVAAEASAPHLMASAEMARKFAAACSLETEALPAPSLTDIPAFKTAAERGLALKALAKASVILPPADWLRVATGADSTSARKAAQVMVQAGMFEHSGTPELDSFPELLSQASFPAQDPGVQFQPWVTKTAEQLSLTGTPLLHAMWSSSFQPRISQQKAASAPLTEASKELAHRYFAYVSCALAEAGADPVTTHAAARRALHVS
jgi:hypothetical protein